MDNNNDGFIPDTAPAPVARAGGDDGFVADTAASTSSQYKSPGIGDFVQQILRHPIDTFRGKNLPGKMLDAINSPAQTATNTLNNAGTSAAEIGGQLGFPKTGAAIGTGLQMIKPAAEVATMVEPSVKAAEAVGQGGGKLIEWLKSLKNAPQAFEDAVAEAKDLHGTSDSLSAVGSTIRNAANNTLKAAENTKNSLYEAIPNKALELSKTQDVATSILSDVGQLPKSIQGQVGKVLKIADDLANDPGNKPTFQVVNAIRSHLSDIRANGEGLEKLYAGKLVGALDEDLKAMGEGPAGKMLGQEFTDSYAKAKGFAANIFQLKDTPIVDKIQNAPIETLPAAIFKGGQTQNVLVARAVLDQDGFNAAKQVFFNQITDSPNVLKTLAKYPKDFLDATFSSTEISALNKVGVLQEAAKAAKTGRKVIAGAAGLGGFYGAIHKITGMTGK